MRLIGINRIDEFVKKHPESENALRRWQKLIVETDYKNMSDLRKTFPSADYVEGKTIFNIGGNKIRTTAIIEYGISQVIITHVLTHREYDMNKWKRE